MHITHTYKSVMPATVTKEADKGPGPQIEGVGRAGSLVVAPRYLDIQRLATSRNPGFIQGLTHDVTPGLGCWAAGRVWDSVMLVEVDVEGYERIPSNRGTGCRCMYGCR
jgi:hypothetical protein